MDRTGSNGGAGLVDAGRGLRVCVCHRRRRAVSAAGLPDQGGIRRHLCECSERDRFGLSGGRAGERQAGGVVDQAARHARSKRSGVGGGVNPLGFALERGTNPTVAGPAGNLFHNVAYGHVTVDFSAVSTCTPPPPAPPPAPPSPPSPLINLDGAHRFVDGEFSMEFKVDSEAERVSIALSSPHASGWVGLCFTTSPGRMGPGHAFVGYASARYSPGFVVSQRLNPAVHQMPQPSQTQSVLATAGAVVDGRLTISFSRSIAASGPGDVTLRNEPMAVVWAYSVQTPDDGDATLESPFAQHGRSEHSTSDIRVNFFTGEVTRDDLRERVITAHAWLMLIAWFVLVPMAILIARYAKDALGANWFRAHMALNLVAVAATGAAFGMAVWYSVEDFDGAHKVHKIIGLIILLATFVEPILGEVANVMWSPDREATPWFPDRIHWWFGRALVLLALVNCFLGMDSKEWGMPAFVVGGVVVGVIALTFAALEATVGKIVHGKMRAEEQLLVPADGSGGGHRQQYGE
ncbi:uncharacterized protein AMSG_01078 [Thecamonas trahens ATCC 50062]|uniref:Cytochrome b561 domain-containing protein n=1 Tax=Thecamonas trahens ATCC 50062 TaxID=461836 RepID=A0A0L0DIN7_THETB|nr:hypothetical protein AMSG_01078 [Thecamonas trahens ATCC 50062]KNC52249.1 hypothetical protein AMSG_01078 [Thecamonas trahens ATCC 50062]|eukprot:XP_013762251.1 hypothetical protein AMSG_01078 [Thecamonas trahens ATCC 50062]